MSIKDLDKDTFDIEINKSGICIVEFYSESCKVCHLMFDTVEKLSSKLRNIRFYKIDAQKNRLICSSRKVLSLPTFLVFKEGILLDKIVGFKEPSQMEESIKTLISK